ncbi:hypothetical protein L484_022184 [Morus notabilis]|uniref:Uncharacterized protein n=1 Tax=Morus notabilis TaxID=981085 RepID=W9R088_9ROSA|nr:hypothetical protein L484_022184 [Morus notabilis]
MTATAQSDHHSTFENRRRTGRRKSCGLRLIFRSQSIPEKSRPKMEVCSDLREKEALGLKFLGINED